MKPKKLFPLACVLFITGVIWLMTLFSNMDWYVRNIQSQVIMAIIVITALLLVFGGAIIILSFFDEEGK